MSFVGSVLNVLLWERCGRFWTWKKKFLEQFVENCSYLYHFCRGHFRSILLLFPSRNSPLDGPYQLSIVRSSSWYWWKSYWGDFRSKYVKYRIFNNWRCSHTHDSTIFIIVWRFGSFLTYLMTSSVGTKDNGPKPTRSGNLQPSVTLGENSRSIRRQMRRQDQLISVRRQKFIHWQRLATVRITQDVRIILWGILKIQC